MNKYKNLDYKAIHDELNNIRAKYTALRKERAEKLKISTAENLFYRIILTSLPIYVLLDIFTKYGFYRGIGDTLVAFFGFLIIAAIATVRNTADTKGVDDEAEQRAKLNFSVLPT